ncbi:MAG: cell division protein ZipA C-terminal FtsZ-binding domain-containing protein [Burkholderiales bacterium]
MTEFQIGLLTIGVLVVAGVLAYNRVQERAARRDAERAFGSRHTDVLLGEDARRREPQLEAARPAARDEADAAPAQPDERLDYVIALTLGRPPAQAVLQEQWKAIERRHAGRALLAGSSDGATWRAGLQLVSRAGQVAEGDLIEFRAAVETLAAAIGATISAPEMKAAIEAAREIDGFCAEADIQVVLHIVAPAGSAFPGTKIRAAAEAAGLVIEQDGKFALRSDDGGLLYTLGARDGLPFAAATMREATPQALTLALDVPRAADTRRSFESMTRLARQLASLLGGSLVDDHGNVLDERAVAAIALQLDAVRARLEARGLPPGSAAALRLFS